MPLVMSKSTRPRRLRAWRVPLVAAGLLIVPVVIEVTRSNPSGQYQPQSSQSAAQVSEADLNLIREAVVRYQIAHLAPNDLAPAAASQLAGVCLGFDRSGGTDPAAAMIANLKDTTLPIAAYTACVTDGMKGRVPLWVVSISSTGANSAQAVGRSVQNSYLYALERRAGVWIVTAAKLTGRA
jgi:hypothetical protein